MTPYTVTCSLEDRVNFEAVLFLVSPYVQILLTLQYLLMPSEGATRRIMTHVR